MNLGFLNLFYFFVLVHFAPCSSFVLSQTLGCDACSPNAIPNITLEYML